MESAILDTTFLIDLQRSGRNAMRKRAVAWLQANRNATLKIPVIVLGEFGAGFDDPDDSMIIRLRQQHEMLSVGTTEAKFFGIIYRKMKSEGNLIGGNDLWIAAIALAAGLPLLTRNTGHFNRVPGLIVESY